MNLARQVLFISLILAISIVAVFAAGELDPTFTASVSVPAFGRIEAIAIQPDGKVIAYGWFTLVSGTPVNSPLAVNLVRINPDGTLDTSFNPPYLPPSQEAVLDIALQSDGKIILAGGFNTVDGQVTTWGIARLNQDGTRDTSFTVNNSPNSKVYDVQVLPDDKIIVPYDQGGLRRLLPNGAIDPTFAGNSTFYNEVGYQPDGKILASGAGSNILSRFNADGTPDGSFTSATFNGRVWDIRVQTDGKIIGAGQFSALNGASRIGIARLNSDGTADGTFTSPFSAGFVFKALPQAGGTTYVCGSALTSVTPSISYDIYRLNSNGSLDTSFIQSTPKVVWDIERQSDGKIFIAGNLTSNNASILFRVDPGGATDSSFNANFGFDGKGRKIFIQPDGKSLVGGTFYMANNSMRNGIARFNADGTTDTSFDALLPYSAQDIWSSIDMQPDGKIIVGNERSAPAPSARRLNSDGSLDITFDSNNVRDVKVLGSGKILFAGGDGTYGYVRLYNGDGTLDGSFSVTANSAVRKVAVQADGKILIGGTFTIINSAGRGRLARLNADGTLDATFDTSTGANDTVSEIVLLSGGQVLIGGAFWRYNSVDRSRIARLNSNGALDPTFAPGLDDAVNSIKVQPDNKILIAGEFTRLDGVPRGYIARLYQDGIPDGTFDAAGSGNFHLYDIEYQNDNKILVSGDFFTFNGVPKNGIVRLENSSVNRTAFDYDGDGKADVSVFRPSTRRWYVFKSSNSTVAETTFGSAGDVIAPADYDGDDKTDLGIFRPGSGDWWYLSSFSGTPGSVHWGASGDAPRPSDFDGDGKADYIVFRPSNSSWYRLGSAGYISIAAFGLSGDKPVTGDFDGDGKSDRAIFRPSTGYWWYYESIYSPGPTGAFIRAVQWGTSTDVPAPADFDGDGKTDFCVYRPSNGTWYVFNSGDHSFTIMKFGIAEDKPVPADYDGDGKADIAVFRPSTGTWYQMKTTAGFSAQQFGISTDIPTENAFAP